VSSTSQAIETIRKLLDEEREARDFPGHVYDDGYWEAPGKALEALTVVEAALGGDAALRGSISQLGVEIVDLRRQRDDLQKANNAYLKRARDAEAEVAKLKEAAVPFVEFAEFVAADHPGWDHDAFSIDLPGGYLFSMKPFRALRVAVEKKSGGA
jgi:hypothetical protein